jgi:DNA-binding transcriptional LysR family regulator
LRLFPVLAVSDELHFDWGDGRFRGEADIVEDDGAFLYYPRRASLAPKLRAFIDVAKKTLQSFE